VDLRVLVVAEHASAKFGGEAALPLHYYRILRQRNVPTWLIAHERTRQELATLFPLDEDRMVFVADTAWHRLMWRLSRLLPGRVSGFTSGFILRLITQVAQRPLIRRLVRDKGISVIHQPTPVSPGEPSLIYGVGVPVIMGPMNGGMEYPPAFRYMESPGERFALTVGRQLATLMNRLIPGKRKAAMLLVANERTRRALPRGACSRVETLVENGVDLAIWKSSDSSDARSLATTRYVFMGRLVDWKAVDLLLLAFKRAAAQAGMTLTIIGDGIERATLERLARNLGLLGVDSNNQRDRVRFLGWMSQPECARELRKSDALVLPSLLECGGAVVLEAMAMEIPVIATAWGGPLDYLDATCGILLEPSSKEAFIEQLEGALIRLAKFPQERIAMGKAGRARVVQYFDWEAKADRMLETYQEVIAAHTNAGRQESGDSQTS